MTHPDTQNTTSAQSALLAAKEALQGANLIGAIAQLTQAVTMDEQLAEARQLRAQTLLDLGDVDGAFADAQWLMEHEGETAETKQLAAMVAQALLMRGKLYYEQGKHEQAMSCMNKALKLNPQQIDHVSGDFKAEGTEHKAKRKGSALNPFGL